MILKKISILICAAALCGIFLACKADLTNKNDPYSGSYVKDNNPYLKSLAFSSGTLSPAFNTEVFSYILHVSKSVESITVTPTAEWMYAGIKINGTAVDTGSASDDIALEIGNNSIEIVVTSEDKKFTQPYTIDIYRAITLPATAQTKCYESDGVGTDEIPCAGTGQDGEYQKGVAWDPAARFTDNGDGTVTDKLTGLVWTRDANLVITEFPNWDLDMTMNDGMIYWQHSLDYIVKLNNEKNYAGYTSWRLPNIIELASLLYYNMDPAGTTAAWLNATSIENVQSGGIFISYYTSTSLEKFPGIAYRVNMGDNIVYADMNKMGNAFYVWAVKSGNAGIIPLPRTGQVKCYSGSGSLLTDCTGTGQDAEYQNGIEWPDPRFIDNGDGTITDRLTGLMWQAQGLNPVYYKNWQEALTCANDLTLASYDDWRLPNINELNSLLNFGTEDNVVWLESYGFSTLQNSNQWATFWSSTTNTSNSTYAWCLNMYYNAWHKLGETNVKSTVYNVIAVRDSKSY